MKHDEGPILVLKDFWIYEIFPNQWDVKKNYP